jgi:tetratricopeptide (TPR) repeat protein
VDAFARYVASNFIIDEENSSDTSQRLRPTEFGYRSVHYVVSFKPPGLHYGVLIEPDLYGLKAEIQLRTVAEHAYADFGHDLSYRGAFELPDTWKRELAGIAAAVEGIDQAFDRIEKGVRSYASGYGAYKDEQELREEIARLELALAYEPDPALADKLAVRISKLAITLEDWVKAEEVLSSRVEPARPGEPDQSVRRHYGYCLCNLHRSDTGGSEYADGRRYLELAARDSDGAVDPEATSHLADVRAWAGDDERARDLYRRAFEAEPANVYALARFLQHEIELTGTEILVALRPTLERAIEHCRAQAAVEVDVPRAYFGIGTFLLLLATNTTPEEKADETAREALKAYAKAIQASAGVQIIADELRAHERLSVLGDRLAGYEWARRMLLLGLATKRLPSGAEAERAAGEHDGDEREERRRLLRERDRELREYALARLRELPKPKTVTATTSSPLSEDVETKPSVVIVVGGTHPEEQAKLEQFRRLIVDAFQDFEGVVVSGGTEQGVSGFVGEISGEYGDRLHTFAHHPRELPQDGTATRDERYDEIRVMVEETSFSPLQSLQDWIAIVLAGIPPRDVKVLGLNGGDIAAVEFRIALGLGASVAVLEGSGREATKLLADEVWAVSETLVPMPIDAQTVRAFIGPGVPPLDSFVREGMAKSIHDHHRKQTEYTQPPWEAVEDRKRTSSRSQAEHNILKLHSIGCEVVDIGRPPTDLFVFSEDEVEQLAEMEHGRWTAELLTAGWRFGEKKDEEAKTHPLLVAWADLPVREREWDKSFIRAMPEILARVNRDIRCKEPNADRPPRRTREVENQ